MCTHTGRTNCRRQSSLAKEGNGLSSCRLSPRNTTPSDFDRSQETRRILPGASRSILLFCRKPASCDALRGRPISARLPSKLRSGSASGQINHPHQIGPQMARANRHRYQPADDRAGAGGGKCSGHRSAARGVCPIGYSLAASLEKSFARPRRLQAPVRQKGRTHQSGGLSRAVGGLAPRELAGRVVMKNLCGRKFRNGAGAPA